jgi:tetratricopeptide (TPR) repeat protein
MKKIITLFFLIASMQTAFAQDIDSLLTKYSAAKNDSLRYETIQEFYVRFSEADPILFLKAAERFLTYSQENKDKAGEAFATSMIGYCYRGLGNITKSLEYAIKGFEIGIETGNVTVLAYTKLQLGHCYKDIKDYEQSVKYYVAAAEIGEKLKYEKTKSVAYQNLGEVYLAMNKLDSALMYEQKDFEICKRIGFYDFFGYTLLTLGGIHGKMGSTALAISYFDLAIEEGFKRKSAKQLNWAYTAKAQFYAAIGKTDSSIVNAKKAISAVTNTGFTNYNLSAAKLLLDNYRNSNADSAFKYSEIYRVTNDSVFSAKAIQQTQLMTFENEKKQQELVQEKKIAEEQRKQNIQYALLALGIITFIISFLLLSRKHITNTKLIQFLGVVALLLVFEFLNLLLHPFLERITHHSPVLMLLALVCIAALLVPLHHKLEKWATHKLVEKNKQIRLAAAKKTIEELENNQTN